MKKYWVPLIFLLSTTLAFLSCDSRTEREEKKDATLTKDKGFLFAAVLFEKTPLGERWAKLRPEAEELFLHLRLKAVADLHMTIVYIGEEWNVEKLGVLKQTLSIPIEETIRLRPEIAYFGKNNRVIAVELKGIPEELRERIISLKMKLNEAGLKSPEAYDNSFRAHVTIAEARDNPPTPEQALELKRFQEWIRPKLDSPTLEVVLDPTMPIQWMLAGATRPTPIPEYVTVESFLSNEKGR